MTTVDTFEVLTLTDEARNVVLDALNAEEHSETLALYVRSPAPAAPATPTTSTSRTAPTPLRRRDRERRRRDDRGATEERRTSARSRLEFANEGGGGLVLVNPNAPTPEEMNPGVPADILALGIEGPLATLAIEVLESSVNPAIASHGGRADLIALDEEKKVAYLKLSGGCQGCAMSRLTLSQGIETQLIEAIPELTGVIDVTDHASGENPFYAKE